MDEIRCALWPPKYKVQFTTNTVQSKLKRKESKLECEYDEVSVVINEDATETLSVLSFDRARAFLTVSPVENGNAFFSQ